MINEENKTTRVGVGVLVIREDRVLLGERCGAHMPGLYAAPGGHLEYGETFAQCAKREVAEETGLSVSKVEFLTIGNYEFDSKHYIDVDMVAYSDSGDPQVLEPDKVTNWQWHQLDDLPSPLFIVTKRMIGAYKSGVHADHASVHDVLTQ